MVIKVLQGTLSAILIQLEQCTCILSVQPALGSKRLPAGFDADIIFSPATSAATLCFCLLLGFFLFFSDTLLRLRFCFFL